MARCRCCPSTAPAARNAFTPGLYAALAAALVEAQADPETDSIVLTGVGTVFGSGSALNPLAQRRAMKPLQRRAGIERLHGLIRSIRSCSKPVIAAVEGAGAHLSIALDCDMFVAARNTAFPLSYGKGGLSHDSRATTVLSDFVSWPVLMESGPKVEHVTGGRLHGLGIVNRLAEPGGALTEAISMAAMFASGPQRVISRIKTLCRHAGGYAYAAQLELEAGHVMESVALH